MCENIRKLGEKAPKMYVNPNCAKFLHSIIRQTVKNVDLNKAKSVKITEKPV